MGRDYLRVGLYTDVLFPEKCVRFIAISNGVDSAQQQENDFTPFLNIINEWYCRDTSKKIRAVMKSKGEAGEHLCTNPPYGYMKSPDSPKQWIVDAEAAEVVKRIFALCLEGYGPSQIACILKADKLFKRIYEDNANGKLSDSRFQMLSDDYEQEQEELREKLLLLSEEITKQEEQAENIDRFIGKVRKYLDLDELTPAILNDMVKAVYVHTPDKSKGHREQQIDISYDLVGILPVSLLNDLQNGETA